jgi:hypothetical protein
MKSSAYLIPHTLGADATTKRLMVLFGFRNKNAKPHLTAATVHLNRQKGDKKYKIMK